nr:sigma factor-like helix-turn-helix DNA-binding protein [Dendrosporobacter quercicolus]
MADLRRRVSVIKADIRKFEDYRSEQIANTIKRYQQVRSSLEYVANRLDRVGKTGARTAKEELLCIIVDIDQGIKHLSPRQQRVILLLQQGYEYKEISTAMGISAATAASHASQAFNRLTSYLNKRAKLVQNSLH